MDNAARGRFLANYRKLKTSVASDSHRKWTSLFQEWKRKTRLEESSLVSKCQSLFPAYRQAFESVRAKQVESADDFRILQLLGCESDELRHSRVLCWLLDRHETHAQGRLGFRLLLRALSLPEADYADSDYRCRCEVAGEESRIDIEVAARRKFIIHIENKIHAAEGQQQLLRESADLERWAKAFDVPDDRIHAYFLTPDGWLPSDSGRFVRLKWGDIGAIFRNFSADARAPGVKWFALHFAEAVEALATVRLQEAESEGPIRDIQ